MSEHALVKARPQGSGLLLIYPISKNSEPMGASRAFNSRTRLDAVDHLIGVALVFPDVSDEWHESSEEAGYVSVRLPDAAEYLEIDDVDPDDLDTEAEFSDETPPQQGENDV